MVREKVWLPAYEDGTVCSETSAYKLQTPSNYPKESTQIQVSLKSDYNNSHFT